MNSISKNTAEFHLPGLFEFYEFYTEFLPLFYEHHEYFYDRCEIGSVYGAPEDCIWGGGRDGIGDADPHNVLQLLQEYGISARLTFSNSLLRNEHLEDKRCNYLCSVFEKYNNPRNGVIVHSDILADYIKEKYPKLYLVSSTTKTLLDFAEFTNEISKDDFSYVVPDFRLNKRLEELNLLSAEQKEKVEFLCNECCFFGCIDRKKCYEEVSRKILGEKETGFACTAPDSAEGYLFSKAMTNPGFISTEDIENIYLPMGFSNFKLEGRTLGSALLLEFILYYMTKPEYHIQVREALYLTNTLDLF